MRLLIATDAWHPQVNGVVRTYERLAAELPALGVETAMLTPGEFATLPCPTYPEIRLALPGFARVRRRFEEHAPVAVHIATEGPVGWMARAYCRARRLPFTTSFHTRFPDYVESRFHLPASVVWRIERHFHDAGAGVMAATKSLADELAARGFRRILPWTRAADTELFKPRPVRHFGAGPVFLYVGRVAVEKNITAFLDSALPGRKVVVGDGPQLPDLVARYPDVTFTGRQEGVQLAESYASADVFVFPSRTDTFGIVQLEAMASGLPVAAYPVTGPVDLVKPGVTGCLGDDLAAAATAALALDRSRIAEHARQFTWEATARMFLANIETALFTAQGRRVPVRRGSSMRTRHAS